MGIENAMVLDGNWGDGGAYYDAKMARLNAQAGVALAAYRGANAQSAALERAIRDFADAMDAANDALDRVLKIHQGV